jgi:hypothetical protein
MFVSPLMFLSPLGERLGEGVQHEDYLLHHPLTQPLPQGGEEYDLKCSVDVDSALRRTSMR